MATVDIHQDGSGAVEDFYRRAPPTQRILARQAAAAILQTLRPEGGKLPSPQELIHEASREASLLSLVSTLDASSIMEVDSTLNTTTSSSSSSSSFYSTHAMRTAALMDTSSSSWSPPTPPAPALAPASAVEHCFNAMRDHADVQRALMRAMMHRAEALLCPCFASWTRHRLGKLFRRWRSAIRLARARTALQPPAQSLGAALHAWGRAAGSCILGRRKDMRRALTGLELLVRYRRRRLFVERRSECFSNARVLTSSFHAWRLETLSALDSRDLAARYLDRTWLTRCLRESISMWRERAKLSKSCILLASARETSKIKACMRVWAQAMESSRTREARARAVGLAAESVGRMLAKRTLQRFLAAWRNSCYASLLFWSRARPRTLSRLMTLWRQSVACACIAKRCEKTRGLRLLTASIFKWVNVAIGQQEERRMELHCDAWHRSKSGPRLIHRGFLAFVVLAEQANLIHEAAQSARGSHFLRLAHSAFWSWAFYRLRKVQLRRCEVEADSRAASRSMELLAWSIAGWRARAAGWRGKRMAVGIGRRKILGAAMDVWVREGAHCRVEGAHEAIVSLFRVRGRLRLLSTCLSIWPRREPGSKEKFKEINGIVARTEMDRRRASTQRSSRQNHNVAGHSGPVEADRRKRVDASASASAATCKVVSAKKGITWAVGVGGTPLPLSREETLRPVVVSRPMRLFDGQATTVGKASDSLLCRGDAAQQPRRRIKGCISSSWKHAAEHVEAHVIHQMESHVTTPDGSAKNGLGARASPKAGSPQEGRFLLRVQAVHFRYVHVLRAYVRAWKTEARVGVLLGEDSSGEASPDEGGVVGEEERGGQGEDYTEDHSRDALRSTKSINVDTSKILTARGADESPPSRRNGQATSRRRHLQSVQRQGGAESNCGGLGEGRLREGLREVTNVIISRLALQSPGSR